jgi:hypothetical protein
MKRVTQIIICIGTKSRCIFPVVQLTQERWSSETSPALRQLATLDFERFSQNLKLSPKEHDHHQKKLSFVPVNEYEMAVNEMRDMSARRP